MTIFELVPEACFIDLEVDAEGSIAVAGIFSRRVQKEFRGRAVEGNLTDLNRDLPDGAVICGHNLLDHDLPILSERFPGLQRIQAAPALDSLFLSPLAFPKKPYHALVKNKTLKSQANRPLSDCEASATVLSDVIDIFARMAEETPGKLSLIASCLVQGGLPLQGGKGVEFLLSHFRLSPLRFNSEETFFTLSELCGETVCPAHLREVWEAAREDDALRVSLAYVVAWLPVAGSDSILPAWVSRRFPAVSECVHKLRRSACSDSDCPYCVKTHNPTAQLQRWFGFERYRPEPCLPDNPGQSLQEALVRAGMNGESLLGILPTGGGKSLCFQLPALYRYSTTGALTIVISPLQALMKDQVENLVTRAGIYSTAALYGLLTLAERRVLLENIALGSIGLLYVSPEQLRNSSFRRAIANRHVECWVYDEAHCLSKWGHDFRPDYLYVGRFIRELADEQGAPVPSICCVTATAKKDVQEEICKHIKDTLDLDLTIFDGGAERSNLSYQVEEAKEMAKEDRIHEILSDRIGFPDGDGTAVIFCATHRSTQSVAEDLQRRGWAAEAFHAGLDIETKKKVFENFMEDRTRVIAATNAFGMGVDKPDIRVVIHAETPGSLENYLQEAGRAGRDGQQAECIILFDQKDLEKQFRLSGYSRLRIDDIQDIWRAIYRADRQKTGEVVLTAQEIHRNTSNPKDDEAFSTTKINTAVAVLERQGFLERNENRPIVFQGRLLVRDEEEGIKRIEALGLPASKEALWKAYLRIFINLEGSDAFGLDVFAEDPLTDEAVRQYEAGTRRHIRPYRFVVNVLNEMASPAAGLLRKGILFSAWIKAGQRANASADLRRLAEAEEAFLNLLREHEPNAEGWVPAHLASINQTLSKQKFNCTTDMLVRFLRQWEQDPRELHNRPPNLEIRQRSQGIFHIRLLRTWQEVANAMRSRHQHLAVLIKLLLRKAKGAESDVLVDFSEHDVLEAFNDDLSLRADPLQNPGNALLSLLTFAHHAKLLDLKNGKALITSAMTLRLNPAKTNRKRIAGFTKGDFAPLSVFYEERILQIHVMAEYARTATRKIAAHVAMIADYFRLAKAEFAKRYLREDQELYRRATSIESFRAIVDDLGNPEQQAIVAATENGNRIVLAGPGSGKTRVITHRCAYLLRVLRLRPENILVLCFNRNACLELRRRIYKLAEDDAHGVIISTYHSLALRLLGRSLADVAQTHGDDAIDFKELLREATRWLRGETSVIGADPDNLREALLGDIRHILIDEYQDIDEDEYAFIRALAGADLQQDRKRPTLMAVGDDDQSIYGFKGANVTFIRRFCQDYEAKEHQLLENYRSSAHIIAASNQLIATNRDRMKADRPIRIDGHRKREPAGGRWEAQDPVIRGRVHRLQVESAVHQSLAVLHEIKRLRERDPEVDWKEFAILARRKNELMPILALLEESGLPFHFDAAGDEFPPLYRIRQNARWFRYLEEHADEEWNASVLRARLIEELGDPNDTWTRFLDEIAREFTGAHGNQVLPVPEIRAFFFDALAERRRQRTPGPGIRLLTVHRAKGLEFTHVFLVDGAWADNRRTAGCRETEEDRRVYYVGMTRACETLTIFERTDLRSRFPKEIETTGVVIRIAPDLVPKPGDSWMHKHFDLLTPDHLYLSFAGRKPSGDPIHRHLANLSDGDILILDPIDQQIVIRDPKKNIIAKLSNRGTEKWLPKIKQIHTVRILAIIERKKTDGDPAYNAQNRTERWEIPLCEIILDEPASTNPGE